MLSSFFTEWKPEMKSSLLSDLCCIYLTIHKQTTSIDLGTKDADYTKDTFKCESFEHTSGVQNIQCLISKMSLFTITGQPLLIYVHSSQVSPAQ